MRINLSSYNLEKCALFGWIFQLIRRSLNGEGKLYHNLPFNHPLPPPSIAYHNHCLHLTAGEWRWHKRKMQFMITKQYQPRAAASAHPQKPYLQLKCNAFEEEERSTGKIIQNGLYILIFSRSALWNSNIFHPSQLSPEFASSTTPCWIVPVHNSPKHILWCAQWLSFSVLVVVVCGSPAAAIMNSKIRIGMLEENNIGGCPATQPRV